MEVRKVIFKYFKYNRNRANLKCCHLIETPSTTRLPSIFLVNIVQILEGSFLAVFLCLLVVSSLRGPIIRMARNQEEEYLANKRIYGGGGRT